MSTITQVNNTLVITFDSYNEASRAHEKIASSGNGGLDSMLSSCSPARAPTEEDIEALADLAGKTAAALQAIESLSCAGANRSDIKALMPIADAAIKKVRARTEVLGLRAKVVAAGL